MNFSDDSLVSVVVTSCGRFDLLRRTLESFDRFNTAPIHSVWITEDSGDEDVHGAIPENWRDRTQVFVTSPRLGQRASIDLAYARVTTPYVFHLEDDWEFYRPGFIEASSVLLDVFSDAFTVWLRNYAHDLRVHYPWLSLGALQVHNGVRFHSLESEREEWRGFSFNPGLRRIADYRKLAPYASYASEKALSQAYGELGFRAVVLEPDAVLHIGWDKHVDAPEDLERTRRRRRRQQWVQLAFAILVGAAIGAALS